MKRDRLETPMLSIRPAILADVPLLRELIQELAEYEQEPNAVLLTEDQLRHDGFGPHPKFRVLIAELDEKPAGHAVFFPFYSTWTGTSLFLEDLFVRERFRGHGVGKALFRRLAELAQKEGYPSIRLDVLDWNQPAIDFYKSLGADYLAQWRTVLLGPAALTRLVRA